MSYLSGWFLHYPHAKLKLYPYFNFFCWIPIRLYLCVWTALKIWSLVFYGLWSVCRKYICTLVCSGAKVHHITCGCFVPKLFSHCQNLLLISWHNSGPTWLCARSCSCRNIVGSQTGFVILRKDCKVSSAVNHVVGKWYIWIFLLICGQFWDSIMLILLLLICLFLCCDSIFHNS